MPLRVGAPTLPLDPATEDQRDEVEEIVTELRTTLIDAYLDMVNNYLSIAVWAEHNGLTLGQALRLRDLLFDISITDHPEA